MKKKAPTQKVQMDRERTMHFTFWELSRFNEATGISIMNGGLTPDKLTESVILELIRAHLLRDDPDLTVDQLALILTPTIVVECMTAILNAWSSFDLPKPATPLNKAPRARSKPKA
jgi:hypothetical protein